MVATRRLAVVVLLGALAAALPGQAAAARPVAGYPETLTTAHFQIHYTGGAVAHAVTHQKAADLAAIAEQAYTTIVVGWGYPAPRADADGLTDIWVQDLADGLLGFAEQDVAGNQSTGWISLDVDSVLSVEVVAHEFTHLIQFGLWVPADTWMLESTAEWAGLAASGYSPFGGGSLVATLGPPDMSLNCTSAACGSSYETAGYTRWEFFQYLTERFGLGIVRDVFAQGAVTGNPAQTGADLLGATLTAKGVSLGDVYNDYTGAQLAGNYQPTGLKGLAPVTYKTLSTGSQSAALPSLAVAVNHLATRYVRFQRGAAGTGPCNAATLNVTVAMPAGIAARPSFYSKAPGSTPVPLTISGSTATLSVPWDTCTGGQDGYLALPNPSLTADAQTFTVGSSIVVDTSTIATAAGPPLTTYTGPAAPVGTGEIAPAIRLYGAQLIRVSAATGLVRLIVFSSGEGKLRAELGDNVIGTYALRAGNNEIRFRLPLAAIKSLRSTSAAAAPTVLTLTSLSVTGAKGTSVARRVLLTKPTRR